MRKGNKTKTIKYLNQYLKLLFSLSIAVAAGIVILFPLGLQAEEADDALSKNVNTIEVTSENTASEEALILQKELDQASRPGTASQGDIVKAGCNIFSEGPGCVFYWILDAISDFVVTIFVSFAALVFDQLINLTLTVDLAKTPFVSAGYAITLGVANMFFVLVLLWIAIATIFDFEPYTARSLLPKLIIAALLINFSLAIGNSFIRLSNGIASIFYDELNKPVELKGKGVEFFGAPIAKRVMKVSEYVRVIDTTPRPSATVTREQELAKIFKEGNCTQQQAGLGDIQTGGAEKGTTINIRCDNATYEAVWKETYRQQTNEQSSLMIAFQAIFWKVLMAPILIFVLLAGAVFLIIRQLSLAFVLVLGPLAFLFMILPATQRFYHQWWEKLTQWSFFFPAFMFFLFLSLQVGGQIFPRSIANPDYRLPVMFQYLTTIALLIGSLLAANQMGIWGASTVTGWGKKMAGAAGGYVKARGWKYAGKGTEAVMGTGVMRALGRIPVIGTAARAAATAVMKKGVGVEKKDIEFYSKLPDRQLATVLSTMREGRAQALWAALPPKRKREAKDGLDELARSRNWPNAPEIRPTPAETIQNQVMPIIQGLAAVRELPENLRTALIDGIRQALEGLPADATAEVKVQTIQQAAQNVARAQPPANSILIQPAVNAIRDQSAQIRLAAERTGAATRATPTQTPESLREELDELREIVESKQDKES